VSGTCVDLL